MKIDLLGGSYHQKYTNLNSQRSINWYPVVSTKQEENKSQLALFPTPGLTKFASITGRYNRNIFNARTVNFDRCFTVVDTTLYEIGNNGTVTNRGSISACRFGSTKIWMEVNGNDQIIIGNQNAGYIFNMSTNTLTQITDPNFPNLDTLTYSDGYFILSNKRAYLSGLDDGINWDGTDVFTPTFRANSVKALTSFREEIYLFGEETMSIYVNDGVSPFSRLTRSSTYNGIGSPISLCMFKDGLLLLGATNNGETMVQLVDSQYNLNTISPFSINWSINQIKSSADSIYATFQYSKDGHAFYYLTIPELHTTFVYDVLTMQWHERRSYTPFQDVDGEYHLWEFRGKYTCNFKGKNLWTDIYSGNIYLEDFTNQTEDGQPIYRERSSQNFAQEDRFISVDFIEIEANTGQAATISGQGSNPTLLVSTSYDGGFTFNQPQEVLLGSLGNYIYRAKMNKLGTGRRWVVKIICTDPIDLMLQGAIAQGSVGSF